VTNNLLLWILLAVSLLLDLLVVALQASYRHARLPYLLNLREGRESAIETTVRLMEEPRLQVGFNLALTLLHFFLAGFFVNILLFLPELGVGLVALYLLIGMILVTIFEYALEARVLISAEENAIRFRGVAMVIKVAFSPFLPWYCRSWVPNANRVTLASMTEEDLKNWVEVGQPEGSLEKGEREMIYSIFQFGEIPWPRRSWCRGLM
jgi:putative hemolysin